VKSLRARYALSYPLWILVCALLVLALRNAGDPSRRHDRILNNDAARLALRLLHASPNQDRYEVVHVAYAGKGEVGPEARWVVLCDRVPHSGLQLAVVVELDAKDGHLLAMRPPAGGEVGRAKARQAI
jgi:hypothetical protein